MFAQALANFGDRIALIADDGRQISYRELAALADASQAAAGADPVRRQLLAMQCENQVEAIATYLGALRAGLPLLLLPTDVESEALATLLDRFDVARVWDCDRGWVVRHDRVMALHPDLAVLLPTSGSTGAAKLVRLTAHNLEANAQAICQSLNLSESERPITVLPFHYSYGLSVVNSHLLCGATILLSRAAVTTRAFWSFLEAERATSLSGVPAIYQMLLRLRFNPARYPSLRTLTQAGGRLDDVSLAQVRDLADAAQCRFVPMYGQTEATARISYLPAHFLHTKLGAIGLPVPGGTLSLKDEHGSEILDAGKVGELHYSGPNVMMGYADQVDDLALGDVCRGELDTGDLAYRDADGCYFIAGRKKRMIKLSGVRFGLDELEAALIAKGYPVALTGEDDRLCVGLDASVDGAVDETALVNEVARQYHVHPSLIVCARVPALPRSAAGKIMYEALKAMFPPRESR